MNRRLLLFSLLIFTVITSCDPCKNVACINDGACQDGSCLCPDGFSGENCEIEDKCVTDNMVCLNGGECSESKCNCGDWYTGIVCETKYVSQFSGTYTGTENCGDDFQNTYYLSPNQWTDNTLEANDNFGFELIFTFETGQTGAFTITSANSNEEINGTGSVEQNMVTFSYTVQVNENDSYDCGFTGTK